MFRSHFQSGFLSLFYSLGSSPLQLWGEQCEPSAPSDHSAPTRGHIQLVDDADIQSRVLEIVGDNLAQTYISSPAHADRELGIKLPVLGLMVKNLEQYFSLEVMVLDDRGQYHRLRASNFQAVTRRHDDILTMPLRLDPGWNQVQLDLADLLRRAYGTRFVETLRVTIHANCRLRRVYFAERPCNEQALPPEFRLYLPVQEE